ncbi:uncharacterized protein EKO05_0010089 [Ascochyta rabiei]|uniref:Phosphoric diester hydrolase n=1 Tax=Didymella rabiei TaxID=5454 RepID=A0A163KLH4_DIDRA|nr:uncharacterized protein EKO05_0010089 [Ascochyta rabiei]KZM27083.1 phosphoric diester hydrolase [Ascochyta rabiei]UPX19838.1 hypothetical protein EKO05_0010089 [Ascochyta rabiei]
MRSFLLAFPALVTAYLAYAPAEASGALQNILKNTDKTDKYRYPTDFTRDIEPKPFHSHNDYWRDVPFYSGLAAGAISTEADVWLIDGTLYVGHEPSALTKSRTLESLYINPILDTLHRMNPGSPFLPDGSSNGIFDTASFQTLYFFIDFKTAADELWPAVLQALEPLRNGSWLSTYDGKSFSERPVTVIGTGNTELSDVRKYLPRDVFLDAPLAQLGEPKYKDLTSNEAVIASTNFAATFGEMRKAELNDTQLAKLREQIDVAHQKGIKARYWNQPNWPIRTRNAIWRTLWEEGIDLLNVDDLKAAAEFWKGE